MQKTCTLCQAQFEVSKEDLAFYDKVSPVINGEKFLIPEPDICPDCRQMTRLAFRNDRSLYKRKCDATGKEIISMYSPSLSRPGGNKPIKVYEFEEWQSDRWDPMDFGRDFDFSGPFFDQWKNFRNDVPRQNILLDSCENCNYSNQLFAAKNCYLMFSGVESEDCFYGYRINYCKNCVDCLFMKKSELCYECIAGINCYNCKFSRKIENCSDSMFLYDCKSCSNCLFCSNLRNKQYYIFNKKYSKEEYEKKLKEINTGSYSMLESLKSKFEEYIKSVPHEFATLVNVENTTGDNVSNAKDCKFVFEGSNIENVAYSAFVDDAKDTMDINYGAMGVELNYYVSTTGAGAYNVQFGIDLWPSVANLLYCDTCSNGTKDCFGCIGLKHKQYCILNKQYAKEEYEVLVQKIIKHMQSTGDWGKFFPIEMSPFDYNESTAIEYFPMTKEEVLSKGWSWHDDDRNYPQADGKIVLDKGQIPDDIKDVDEDFTKKIILCENTLRPFKIIPQELKFYQEQDLPIPRLHPDERHKLRLSKKNPRKLWERSCDKCQAGIVTSYSPERIEKVYCEKCYQGEIY